MLGVPSPFADVQLMFHVTLRVSDFIGLSAPHAVRNCGKLHGFETPCLDGPVRFILKKQKHKQKLLGPIMLPQIKIQGNKRTILCFRYKKNYDFEAGLHTPALGTIWVINSR